MKWYNAVPWVIAIFGWIVAHYLSWFRELRKEVRQQVDKVYELIAKIEYEAINFHSNTTYNQGRAETVLSQLSTLVRTISRIPILNESELSRSITNFRQSITLHNFDQSNFQTQSHDSEILNSINTAAYELDSEVEQQYLQKYIYTFPFVRFDGKLFYFLIIVILFIALYVAI